MRASILDIGRHCPLAPRLAKEFPGAGRAALQSSAFHASEAGAPDARERWDRLMPEEQAEIGSWYRPLTLTLNGVPRQVEQGTPGSNKAGELKYDAAQKEVSMAINAEGDAVKHGHPNAVIEGTADMLWVHGGVTYVGDLKRSWFTIPNAPESLQMLAYGFMAAALRQTSEFCVGIWAATEGVWNWGPIRTTFLDDETDQLWSLLLAAADNVDGDPVTGRHCRHCYQRGHCPEWALPADLAESRALAIMTKMRESDDVSDEDLLELHLASSRAEEAAKHAKEELRGYVSRARPSGLVHEDMIYRERPKRGRESVNIKELRAGLGQSVERYIKRGKTGTYWDWGKK